MARRLYVAIRCTLFGIAAIFLFANIAGWMIDGHYPGEVGNHKAKVQVPITKKVNPIWWIFNDHNEQVPDWYMPEWSSERRYFYWTFFAQSASEYAIFRAWCVGPGLYRVR